MHFIFLLKQITTEQRPMTIFNKKFIFFFVFITFSSNSVIFFSSAALVSFADRCASIAPDYSAPERYAGDNSSVHRLVGFYHTAGGTGVDILSQNSTNGKVQNLVEFLFWCEKPTEERGLFRVRGSLRFPSDKAAYFLANMTSSIFSGIGFKLNGIWSEASGELCMVGSGSGPSNQGNLHEIPAVLKLNKLKNSNSLASLISGTLKSLITSEKDSNYIRLIFISMIPLTNYQYTFVSNKSDNSNSGGSYLPTSSLEVGRFCSVISSLVLNHEFALKYSSHCILVKNCSPLTVSYLPNAVSLKNIECLEDEKRLRVLVDFAPSRNWLWVPFNTSTTLVGEGSWDAKKNQLNIVACRFLNATYSLSTSHVGDCSTRVSLRFPATWTIGNTSSIVGNIWSNKDVAESGYFENIAFEDDQTNALEGQKYKYTQMDRVTNWCPPKKTGIDKNNTYPHPCSYDMRFDISVKDSTGRFGWGYTVPVSVGSQLYHVGAPVSYEFNHSNSYNISYRVHLTLTQNVEFPNDLHTYNTEIGISAEGLYDYKEGSVCMVGCRYLDSFVDCEIVVMFQFPSTSPKKYSDCIKGSIESTRKKSDPLHFERLELTSGAGYNVEASEYIETTDLEIILVVVSNTLACVFGALQLFHVKRHPDVLHSISILMLFILALGYTIPLLLNFDAMFSQNSRQTLFLGIGWMEFTEVTVWIITMVGFFLQIRLVELTILARSENENQRELWAVEKLVLFVAFPVYVAGSIVAFLLINCTERDYMAVMDYYQGHPILGNVFKSCAGLVLDAFLFPQILLNMFSRSTEKALSVSFYIGTTFVRVLPHAFDLHRDHTSPQHELFPFYIYATPVGNIYSAAWDVIIPCGALLLAGILYLQQRFGGRCFLPQKLRELDGYEKAPTM